MKVAAALLRQWYNDNPARLLQAALSQAERLAEMAPQLEALRTENTSLHQQLEAKAKRLAQVEKALEADLAFVAETPRGGFVVNMELQPEAPLAATTERQQLKLDEKAIDS